MTRSEIIELSNTLTERKGEKVLNLQSLYRFVLQDICKRQRFWWRRILVNFQLTPGITTYDTNNATLFPSLAEIAMEEITKFTIILAASPYQTNELLPMLDPETLIDMLNNAQIATPSRYTMDANSSSVLRIDPPDQAYNAFIVGWAMPDPPTDSANDAVPLIPTWGHNTIVSGLNAKIFKFAYGSKNPKTGDAQEEYEQGILDLSMRPKFDPNYSSQLQLNESAVRST